MEDQNLDERLRKFKEKCVELVQDPGFIERHDKMSGQECFDSMFSEAKDYAKEIAKKSHLLTPEIKFKVKGRKYDVVKRWKDMKLSGKDKEYYGQKKVAFYHRSLEILEEKWGLAVKAKKPMRNARDIDERLKEDENLTKYIVDLVDGNEIDFGDIISIIYSGEITPDKRVLRDYLKNPILRKYIGKTGSQEGGIISVVKAAEKILPYDPSGKVKEILEKRLIDNRTRRLGNNPNKEQIEEYRKEMRELRRYLEK